MKPSSSNLRTAAAAVVTAAALAGASLSLAAPGPAAAPPSSGQEPHLLVVPDSARAEAALAASAASVIARYESFTLAEARGSDVGVLTGAGASVRDDMREVRIGTRTEDPTTARPALLGKRGAAQRTAGKGSSGLAVVQYVGPLKDAWTKAVTETGVEVVSYMAQNGQLLSGSDEALERLAQLGTQKPFIRAITPYTAADKQLPGLNRAGRTTVVISTVAGEHGETARAAVRRVSTAQADTLTVARFTQQRVTIDGARLGELAELGGVVAIEPFVAPELLDERAATIVAGNINSSFQPVLGSGYRAFLSSKGIPTSINPSGAVDITDEGIDKGIYPAPAGSHPDFYKNGSTAQGSRIVYAQEATAADANARDCGGHGTNVASIATGYNAGTGAAVEDAQGFNYGLGIAPFARVGATKIFNCAGSFDVTSSITALHNNAYASGARISNNSWGSNVGGAYNATSQEFDSLVRDAQPGVAGNQGFVELVAAGNQGDGANTVGSPGTAKNVITVGASENVRPIGFTDGCGVSDAGANSVRDIIDFSSRGPTDDSRTKPDIVAPGTHVTGAQPQTGAEFNGSGTCNPQFPAGSSTYTLVSGTSQATPEATGMAAILRTWYRNALGGGTRDPSPAMTKALMVNAATDLAGGDAGDGTINTTVPTHVQGWGRINLGTVLDGTSRQVFDQTSVFASTGQAVSRYFDIASAAKPLRVTLVWSDAVGPTTGNSFVNDLDIEVTAAGKTYKGNVMSGGQSAPGGTSDPRNNVENVLLPAGISGAIKVRVFARNIAGDAVPGNADTTDQDYALLVSNAGPAQASRPILNGISRTVTAEGDGDPYLEPGEPFTFSQRLRNDGNATATGVTGTLSGPRVTVNTGSASWANIASGASAVNSPAFRATVKTTVGCGAKIPITIAVNSNGGPLSIGDALQIGRPATTAVARQSSDVPKGIPDDNPTGVTSNIVAPAGSGVVSDIRVRIGQITHTYVGDLTIDLTAPDGTTVRLINQSGGTGDNMTNTVFDDAAATSITSVTSSNAPFTGSYRPFEPLSGFDGHAVSGTWKLTVADHAIADVGTLSAWGHSIKGFTC